MHGGEGGGRLVKEKRDIKECLEGLVEKKEMAELQPIWRRLT